MELSEIIEAATDAAERPDFTMDSVYVRSVALRALTYAHTCRDFDQDLTLLEEPLNAIGNSISITLPDDYRELSEITLLDAQGNPMLRDFKRGKLHRRPSDYFGLEYPDFFFIFGNELKVTWRHSTNQGSLAVTYYKLPVITYDSVNDEWVTDSWIAKRYPNVIIYEIAKTFGISTESSQAGGMANLADADMYSLINDVNGR